MHNKKENKKTGDDEVNGSRRLLPAEETHQNRKYRSDRGRHGEASPDHQRKQNEDHH